MRLSKPTLILAKALCFVIPSFLITSLFSVAAQSPISQNNKGGVRGTITASDGGPLAFASIYVKQLGTGTAANVNGVYEITLAPGRYDLVFQYLSYESLVRVIEVRTGFIDLNVTLKPQSILLNEVVVGAGDEDPAYSIMRKAIAKANYHRQQLDSYSARVYIKGTGKLKDYPWLAKRALQKNGIEKDRVYILESVSDIKYTRPNKFEEKVISIHSDINNQNGSPNGYIFGSFYEPDIAGTVSPLSPKAFSYYRFEYEGTFKDRDYAVSRIKVIPRSKGDNVVEGMIFIVEDWWSIHSLDINTIKMGIKINIKSVYAPIEDKAWLPVSHRFKVDGKIFGFEFEYNYLATVSDYKIKLNPKLIVDKMEIVDEKIEKQHAKEVEKKFAPQTKKKKNPEDQAKQLQERLASGQEITRKELKTIVKEYEKEERKQQKEPEVLSDVSFKIDSGAYKKDSLYWAEVRPVPLTREEIKGYEKEDSLAVLQKKKQEGDTVKQSKHKGFQPWDILTGDNYKLSKHSNFKIRTPMGGFNTVEGFNIIYRLSYGTIFQDTNRTQLTITPVARYAFARDKLTGMLNVTLKNKKYRLNLQGGTYIRQYNQDEPILPIVNTFTTLLLEKNLMKIYERDFIDLNYRRKLGQYVSINTSWSWMRRYELMNNTDYKWVNRRSIEGYTPNRPVNDELVNTSFPSHDAFVGSFNISARPWLKFKIRNGERYEIGNSSPMFTFDYKKGFNNILNSSVDFDQIELGMRHQFNVGIRGRVDFWLRSGMFLNSRSMYFMDYKHFLGNQTPFVTTDPVGSFRLLDYYRYSTADKYFVGNMHYHFRRFLLTSIPYVRLAGISENVFVNYLATPTSKNYTEVGYSIDGILRLFRLEAVAAFQNGQYLNYGLRIGISTNLSGGFSDN